MELPTSMEIISVISNTTKPESELKKKNNTVCYQTVSLTAHIDGDENPADLLTKVMMGACYRDILALDADWGKDGQLS